MNRFIQINEEGFFHFNGLVLSDKDITCELFESMRLLSGGQVMVTHEGLDALVEAYDAPLVVQKVVWKDVETPRLVLCGGFQEPFQWSHLRLDSWDRFCGLSQRGLFFTLSRKAQHLFFHELESFTDDTITVSQNQTFKVPPFMAEGKEERTSEFWDQRYRENPRPPWELEEGPSPVLKAFWPRLKMLKSRILVLGCGGGHDAFFLAGKGHAVTALDFSSEALKRAKKQKPSSQLPLRFLKKDVFQLESQWDGQFDVVFEHTLFCAVAFSKRQDLIKTYCRTLTKGGIFLGIFFVHSHTEGPPYGSSEWELVRRFEKEKGFRILHWFRSKDSSPNRLGLELVVTAEKL